MKNTPWPYEHTRERIAENAAALGSGALLCFGLSQIFNPLVLFSAAGYGIIRTAMDFKNMMKPDSCNRLLDKTPGLQRAPEKYAHVRNLVTTFSRAADMPPPELLLASDDFAAKNLSWYSRKKIKTPEYRGSFMSTVMFTNPAMNYIATTPEFLEAQAPETTRFALAHEIAHIKSKDYLKAFTIVSIAKVHVVQFLSVCSLLGVGAFLVGAAAPLSSLIAAKGISGLLWAGATLALTASAYTLGMNYASRLRELRADRNAVYLTGETQSMSRFLILNGGAKPPGMIWEWGSHPSHHRRLTHLQEAYALASQYPPAASATHRGPDHPSRSGRGGPRLF